MALPTALPQPPIGPADQGKQEYLTALQQVMQSLQGRQEPNWFSLAGALLQPGKTGSFGEAMGAGAAELGRQQSVRDERAPGIAMMKAQIAAQKYELGNQEKAMQLMAGTLGTDPQVVANKIESGNFSQAEMTRLAQIYPQIAILSPKIAEIVKGSFSMQNEMLKQVNEDRKAGMSQAELVAKYGPGVLQLIPQGPMAGTPTAQPAPAQATPQPAPAPAAKPAPVAPAPAAAAPTPSMLPPRSSFTQEPPNPQLAAQVANAIGDTAQLPLAAQAEVGKKRVEEADKPYNLRRDEILSYTPQLVQQSNTNLRQLDDIATRYPRIFGLMQQQGLLAGLATAAQEGAQLTAGDFNARVGLPVREFLQRVKLTPDEQQKVRDVTRILANEFLSNVKANKGLLGVNPTDNDARLLQAPMASIDDSSRAVQFWARQQLLLNRQRSALYDSFSKYMDKAGAAASPRGFFGPNTDYERINKEFADMRMRLYQQFNPE